MTMEIVRTAKMKIDLDIDVAKRTIEAWLISPIATVIASPAKPVATPYDPFGQKANVFLTVG
jgi:hypothetical protein